MENIDEQVQQFENTRDKCCVCLYAAVVGGLLIGGLIFGTYLAVLLAMSYAIDTCAADVFHCDIATYLISAGILITFVALLICVCNSGEIYRAYLTWRFNNLPQYLA